MSASIHAITPASMMAMATRTSLPTKAGAGRSDALDSLPKAARETARQRAVLVMPVVNLMARGIKQTIAIDHLITSIETGNATKTLTAAGIALGRGGKCVSRPTLHRWVADYQSRGLVGLAPGYVGSERTAYGWEARAMYHYQRPTKPAFNTVAMWLRNEGFESATDSRVRRYLKSLPTNKTTHAPSRVGRHFYNQNLKPYIVRDHTTTPVGFCYQGDGHNCDVYVVHPQSGNHFRPELTAWVDVRSRYLVGWWISEAESAVTTLYAISHAIVKHDHVPAAIHTDPGSGFTNRMMNDEVTGYFARLSIEAIRALPGNAKGKGIIERWFGIFEERCGKQFETYCGHCRTDDMLSRFETKVRRGQVTVPTLAQYMEAIGRFVEEYNNTPQRGLDGATPASLWATLERTPVEMPSDAIVRPQETRRVRRWGVQIFGHLYRHEVLAGYEGVDVVVEYDLHDGRAIVVRDAEGRYLCDARLVESRPGLPEARIEQLQQQRLRGQHARLAKKADELAQRAGLAITHDQVLKDLEQAAFGIEEKLSGSSWAAGTAHEEEASSIPLDLTSLDY